MEITKIKTKKNMFKVVLESGENLILSGDTIVKFGLSSGSCEDDLDLNLIVAHDKSNRIMADALALIAKHSFSCKSLADKLISKGYEMPNIKDTIKRLQELNYIDDDKYAASYAKHLFNRGKGELIIKNELEKHGISKDSIKTILANLQAQKEPFEQIVEILKVKFKKMDSKDKNEVRKVAGFFMRRGFSAEDVAKGLREYRDISLEE